MSALSEPVAAVLRHGVARRAEVVAVAGAAACRAWVDAGVLVDRPGRLVVHPPAVDRFTPLFEVQARCPGAVASERLAAWLHGIAPLAGPHPPPPAFVSPTNSRLACVRRVRDLAPADVTVVAGLRVTTPERTVADLGRDDPELQEQVGEACLARGATTEARLGAVVARLGAERKAGVAALARFLRRRGPGTPPCASVLETRTLQLIRRLGYPEPTHRQFRIERPGAGPLRVDFAWAARRRLVLVEVDGASVHANPEALVADLRRQNQIQRLRPVLLRFSAEDVDRHPRLVDEELGFHLPHRRGRLNRPRTPPGAPRARPPRAGRRYTSPVADPAIRSRAG